MWAEQAVSMGMLDMIAAVDKVPEVEHKRFTSLSDTVPPSPQQAPPSPSRPLAPRGRCPARPPARAVDFAYKALDNKDSLHIFLIVLCFICTFRIV